jgi:4-oxalocrotonate tautomerase
MATALSKYSSEFQGKIKRRAKSWRRFPGFIAENQRSEAGRGNASTSQVPGNHGRKPMPLIQVRVIKDVFSNEQKRQIINKLTDAMVAVEGEAMRGVTWCVIEEVESGDWGIGGKALTTADVHALARGKAA